MAIFKRQQFDIADEELPWEDDATAFVEDAGDSYEEHPPASFDSDDVAGIAADVEDPFPEAGFDEGEDVDDFDGEDSEPYSAASRRRPRLGAVGAIVAALVCLCVILAQRQDGGGEPQRTATAHPRPAARATAARKRPTIISAPGVDPAPPRRAKPQPSEAPRRARLSNAGKQAHQRHAPSTGAPRRPSAPASATPPPAPAPSRAPTTPAPAPQPPNDEFGFEQ